MDPQELFSQAEIVASGKLVPFFSNKQIVKKGGNWM